MNFINKIQAEWPLRLGLGLMYLYSSYDIFYHTQNWKGYIPQWFFHLIIPIMSIDLYLKLQAVGEFVIALLFLAWFSGKWGVRIAAILSTIEMLAIILLSGIDNVTFRDIGLLGASLSLLIISFQFTNSTTNDLVT